MAVQPYNIILTSRYKVPRHWSFYENEYSVILKRERKPNCKCCWLKFFIEYINS